MFIKNQCPALCQEKRAQNQAPPTHMEEAWSLPPHPGAVSTGPGLGAWPGRCFL